MSLELLAQLRNSLAESDSRARKSWARQISESQQPLEGLLSLLHGDHKTAQRFTWLISDVGEIDVDLLTACMPILFSLRNQMPFPGMPRSIAKWLLLTRVPKSIEAEAFTQLTQWMEDEHACIASKSFSARVLFELAVEKRMPKKKVKKLIQQQVGTKNAAFSGRMEKLLTRLSDVH